MAKRNDSGEYVSAHVTQATARYNQLMQSGTPVQSYEQRGDTVYFRTAQPAPLPRRRRSFFRWWMWIVGAVVAFFVVAALLNAGILAASAGAALAGVLLFGALGLIVWRASNNRGFIGTMIGGLVCAILAIGAMTSVEPLYNQDAANRQASIIAECGGIGGGDVQCRWDSLVDSTEKLIDVAQSPASEGLGATLLIVLALMFGGGYLYWRSQGLK